MKDIVIIADFCSGFDHKGNNRFIYLANLLIENGNSVEIITSDFFHGTKKTFTPIINEYDGAKVTMLHEPQYQKNVSLNRFYSHYKWGKNVYKYLKNRKRPDVVYCAIPTLRAASLAGKYCNKNHIKFVIDIQDLWPEAYKMVFNVPILSSIVFSPFSRIANSAYKRADEIIAVSKTYVDRAMKKNNNVKKGYSVFLGTDLKAFDKNVSETKLIKKTDNEIWLGYCGTLGASYDLETVFSAIRIVNNPNLKFVVMGDGPKRKEFEDKSKDINILFTGKLPYNEMCGVLSECDIVVNPIMGKSAASIINKHADYAACGKPVLNTQESKEYCDLVSEYNMGFNVPNGNAHELANRMNQLIEDSKLRDVMGNNARKCAEELFDRKHTYQIIVDTIEKGKE